MANEDKIKILQDKIVDLTKQISSAKKVVPGDDAMSKSQDSTNPVGQKRKLQFLNKKLAGIEEIKQWNQEINDIRKEIEMLKQAPEQTPEEENKKPEKGKEEKVTNENKMAKLTKQDIFRLVEQNEPARMTKQELIESISRQLVLSEDMNDDLRRKIERGETDYSEHIDPEMVKQMSREIMSDISSNLQSKSGGQANMHSAQMTMAQGLMGALQIEARMKTRLEQLAVRLVREEYDIPEDAVDFEVHITGHPSAGGRPISKERLKMKKGNKPAPQGKTSEELKPNVTKRRLVNAMIHGAARKGQNLYHLAQEELNRINPTLVQNYGKIMAGNDFMYWAMNDMDIAEQSESGEHAGQVTFYPYGNPPKEGSKPKIVAEGMTFPFLLHELTKGVLEMFSQWGREADKETREYVEDKTDNLESEPWDIRLGSKIWEKFLQALDADDIKYKNQIYTQMVALPANEFNQLVNGLLKNSPEAKRTIDDIAYDVRKEMGQEDLDTAMGQFSDEGGLATPEGPEEGPEEDDILKKIQSGSDNPETWSKRDLESAIDDALDAGDYKAAGYYQSIIDKKF